MAPGWVILSISRRDFPGNGEIGAEAFKPGQKAFAEGYYLKIKKEKNWKMGSFTVSFSLQAGNEFCNTIKRGEAGSLFSDREARL